MRSYSVDACPVEAGHHEKIRLLCSTSGVLHGIRPGLGHGKCVPLRACIERDLMHEWCKLIEDSKNRRACSEETVQTYVESVQENVLVYEKHAPRRDSSFQRLRAGAQYVKHCGHVNAVPVREEYHVVTVRIVVVTESIVPEREPVFLLLLLLLVATSSQVQSLTG